MRKLRYSQEFRVEQEDGTPIKECTARMYVVEHNMEMARGIELFESVATDFVDIIDKEVNKLDGDHRMVWSERGDGGFEV